MEKEDSHYSPTGGLYPFITRFEHTEGESRTLKPLGLESVDAPVIYHVGHICTPPPSPPSHSFSLYCPLVATASIHACSPTFLSPSPSPYSHFGLELSISGTKCVGYSTSTVFQGGRENGDGKVIINNGGKEGRKKHE